MIVTSAVGVAALLGALIAASGTSAHAAGAPGPKGRTQIGLTPVLPAGTASVGALPANTPMHVDIALRPHDPAALTGYATAVSTPGSPEFHHYLTVQGFAATFGATDAAIAQVDKTLSASGLHVGPVSANRLLIPVSGSAIQVENAFSASLVKYRLRTGRVAFANAAAPSLPAAVAPYVEAVVGLDNLHQVQPLLTRPAARNSIPHPTAQSHTLTGGPQPCSQATTAANASGSYTADQLADAYGYSGLYSAGDLGSGQTIALYELEPNSPSDIAAYQACYNTHNTVSYVTVDGGAGSGPGSGEAALDIETVMSLAPNANLLVYQGPNNGPGPYDTFARIVSQDRASVISVSWGECEQLVGKSAIGGENVLFEEAAAQGQTFVVAAGDTGSEGCFQADRADQELSVQDPASQPFVTSVGGTSLGSIGPPPSETVWNDGYDSNGAGGGGVSGFSGWPGWPSPSYQTQYGIGGSHREVPDVAADADPQTGYTIYWAGNWHAGIGGTSAATPLWAALFGLANASCATRIGFANPALYHAYSRFEPTKVGYDIQAAPNETNNDYTGANGGEYPVLVGYDMATGLGSPIASALAGVLCSMPGWTPLAGFASDISVGASGQVWVIGTGPRSGGYGIYRWTGSGWAAVPGGAVTIAVDPQGDPWVLNSNHQIYHWNGHGFAVYPGSAYDISVGADGQVWVIGTGPRSGGYGIYRWTGSGWAVVPGAAVTIGVDPKGEPWVLNSSHQIYHWTGSGFSVYPGAATDIAVGANGEVWVIGTGPRTGGYGIYWWTGRGWSVVPGGAVTVAVDPRGNPWVINTNHEIYEHG
jgi:subtilase family serine protease